MQFLLSLDEGTTSARAAVYGERGERVGMESCAVTSDYPRAGWVEQDAEEIWRLQLEAARRVLRGAGIGAGSIAALGITNQRETTVVWERKSGKAAAPAIVWQCRRTARACAELVASEWGPRIRSKTGLEVDAYFSASKIQWLLEQVPDARRKARDGELLFGTVDTWLVWKLTNGAAHVTDFSNASRTMLMNLETGEWDEEMLDLFEAPRAMLPRIVGSSGVVGIAAGEHLGPKFRSRESRGINKRRFSGRRVSGGGLPKTPMGRDVSR